MPRECINSYDAKQQREKRENDALSYSSSEVVAGATGEKELGRARGMSDEAWDQEEEEE